MQKTLFVSELGKQQANIMTQNRQVVIRLARDLILVGSSDGNPTYFLSLVRRNALLLLEGRSIHPDVKSDGIKFSIADNCMPRRSKRLNRLTLAG